MSKLSIMNGRGLNHLPLVQGIKDLYIRQRVAKEAQNWRMMEEAFNSISKMQELQRGQKLTTSQGVMTSHLSMQYIVNIRHIMNKHTSLESTSHIISCQEKT